MALRTNCAQGRCPFCNSIESWPPTSFLAYTRRDVLRTGVATRAAASSAPSLSAHEDATPQPALEEFASDQVSIRGVIQNAQWENVTSVLMGLSQDSLHQPFREMAGKIPATVPGSVEESDQLNQL